jgi:bifunctional non-homologous end joining protein LigD
MGKQKKEKVSVSIKASKDVKGDSAKDKKIHIKNPTKKRGWVKSEPTNGEAKSENMLNDTFPKDLSPMLATLVEKSIEKHGWMYEVKWDGFRALAYLDKNKVELRSRNNKTFNDKFYPIYNSFKEWNIDAVFDGEIVVISNQGFSDFAALQTWRSEADGELAYYIFDILWYEGRNLMNTPLAERRKILQKIIPSKGNIRLSENFEVSANDFIALAEKMGLEGIIAKKENSLYKPGLRSKEWIKIKTKKHQEAIVAGYTKNENTSKKFSALLLGVYEDNELVFIGPVGTGFTVQVQNEILEKLNPLKTLTCPFNSIPEYNKPSRFRPNPPRSEVTWVKPELVVEITYLTVAPDGTYRHPSFRGIREDKKAREIVRENAVSLSEDINEQDALLKKKLTAPKLSFERRTLLNPVDEVQVRSVDGHELKFPNLSKIFWPEENISKRDMLNYYYQVAPYILPYIKDRPQTLNRFPNGIYQQSFYQKDVTGKAPEWIKTFKYYSERDEREKNFLVCSEEVSLLYIASLGCIEVNPWSSRIQSPDNPDWCIIDLDPDKNTFEQVITAAQVTKQILDSIGVTSFCKTSGSTGLHIYIPLDGTNTYEDSKEFGRAIAKLVHKEIPEFSSIERLTSKRNGKMYIDFLQNRPQATVAAPYSLRPKPGATVSTPLHWEEVKKGLTMQQFNIHNTISRIKAEGDLFSGVLDKGIDMAKAIEKINKL